MALTGIGWDGGISAPAWTIIMMIVATFIYLFLIAARNMREAALVGAWGLAAIAYKQWGLHQDVVYTAIGAAVVLFIAASYHGYKNRETAPIVKWKNRELF